MLKIATAPKFTAVVRFETPSGDGRPERHQFTGVFKSLGLTEYTELMKRAYEDPEKGDALVLEEVLVGWEGVGDEHGTPLEFTPANCDRLMEMMGARAATVRTFVKTLTGAREKN